VVGSYGENVVLTVEALQLELTDVPHERNWQIGGEASGANQYLPARLGNLLQTADNVHRQTDYRKIQAIGTSNISVHHWPHVQSADEGR
jgi:hypothetical protein